MPEFWRTYNNQLYSIGNVESLGFAISDASYIPDAYLNEQNFIIRGS